VRRREFIAALLAAPHALAEAGNVVYPSPRPGTVLQFPRDHGSHAAFRTEWWYVTGWAKVRSGADLGLQITFFRSRTGIGESNPSRFAPRQLLFAHAALSDARIGHLLHDQRAAREGFGLAAASEADTNVRVDDWSLVRGADGYDARVPAREFEFALRFRPMQAPLLQGDRGFSRKGPDARQSSYYYSIPHLQVSGAITTRGGSVEIESGEAWLDHEWSSEVMSPQAVGWDWVGLNLADGGALMAFRMRDKEGGTLWAGGTHRGGNGSVHAFRPEEVAFSVLRRWRSPRTDTLYPVSMRVTAGGLDYTLEPMMDDQELDSRASTGAIYWEGSVTASASGRSTGRGYLELTGYWKPLRL